MRGSCEPFSRGPKRPTGESARNRKGATYATYSVFCFAFGEDRPLFPNPWDQGKD
jgi:hypothetical protein